MHLVWPSQEGSDVLIRYAQLDGTGSQVVNKVLDLPEGQMRSPRLLAGGDEFMHLLWADRNAGENWKLWYVLLDTNGNLQGSPLQLSDEESDAGSFSAAGDPQLGVLVLWEAGGLVGARVDSQGALTVGPQRLSAVAGNPDVRFDLQGNAHVAWLQGPSIYYQELEDGRLAELQGNPVTDLLLSPATSLSGPVVGLSDGWVYIFWSLQYRTGTEAGSGYSEFVAFPARQALVDGAERIYIFPLEEPPYQVYQGDLPLTQYVPPASVRSTSDYVLGPATPQGENEELVVALGVNQAYRQDIFLQTNIAVFRQGQFVGYSQSGKTKALSSDPVVALDTMSYIHLAWRDGSSGQRIYYATNNPTARANLDRLTGSDFFNALLQGSLESLTSIMLMPVIGFGWMLSGMVLIGIWKLVREHENLKDPLSLVFLVLAILIYEVIKLITLPDVTAYVPFSAWIDIPTAIGIILQVVIPFVILGVALLAAYRIARRDSGSTLIFYIVFAITDAVLTLAVYGVIFLGV